MRTASICWSICWIALACAALHATPAGNAIEIVEINGTAIASRPITIGRPFVKGEFAAYVQPVVNGTPAAAYQDDNCNRWADGSLKWCQISFWIPAVTSRGTVTVSFQATANRTSSGSELDQAGVLAFNSGNWNSSIEAMKNGNTQSAVLKTMIAAGAWRYRLKGPVVTEIIVEGGSSTSSANLDPAHAFDYDIGWDSYKSLHPIFIATFYPGWAGVRVQGILENAWASKLEDVAYTYTIKSGPDLGTAGRTEAVDGAGGRSKHYIMSRWHHQWWDGSAPGVVDIDHNLVYLTRTRAIPNYRTDFTLGADAEYGVGLNATLQSWAACPDHWTSFNFKCENFGKEVLVNHAMPSPAGHPMRAILPSWDVLYLYHPIKQPSDSARLWDVIEGAASHLQGYWPTKLRETDTTGAYCGLKCTGANAAAPAFGRYLTVDHRPDFSTNSYNDLWHVSSDTPVPAGPWTLGERGTPGDQYDSYHWMIDTAHQPMSMYTAYLLSGDWFYLDELLALAHYDVGMFQWRRHQDLAFLYGDSYSMQIRGVGWTFRTLAFAAFIAPDNTPEQQYLLGVIRNNGELYEGQLNITNGNYPPADPACPAFSGSWGADWDGDNLTMATARSSLWCTGLIHGQARVALTEGFDGVTTRKASLPNPLHNMWSYAVAAGDSCYQAQSGGAAVDYMSWTHCGNALLLWHDDFVRMAFQLTLDLDLQVNGKRPFQYVQAVWNENLFGMLNSAPNPYLLGLYTGPSLDRGPDAVTDRFEPFQTWADWWAAVGPVPKAASSWTAAGVYPNSLQVGGFADGDWSSMSSWEEIKFRRLAVLAMTYDATDANGLKGKTFYDQAVANGLDVKTIAGVRANPAWAIGPYIESSPDRRQAPGQRPPGRGMRAMPSR